MNYSGLAPLYQFVEKLTIGPALQNARVGQLDRLSKLTSVRDALLIGEGDGSFLIHFMHVFPEAKITIVEQSQAMVERAKARLASAAILSDRVEFIVADILTVSLRPGRYDLITTLFFFDNFDDQTARLYMKHIEMLASGAAYWLLSDFNQPAFGWRRMRAQIWLGTLYLFFRVCAKIPARKLPDIEQHFASGSLELLSRNTYCGELLYSSLYQFKDPINQTTNPDA